jgi:hypothetical protein
MARWREGPASGCVLDPSRLLPLLGKADIPTGASVGEGVAEDSGEEGSRLSREAIVDCDSLQETRGDDVETGWGVL